MKDLQTVLRENKIKMRKQFLEREAKKRRQERKEKIFTVIIALFLIFMTITVLFSYNEYYQTSVDKCSLKHDKTWCERKLG